MRLKLYNTLTRKKELFQPLAPPKVTMYVCGVTVYDDSHLGHARAAVVFDVFYRFLNFLGYDVLYVRNFTDVDDKIIKRAQKEGKSCQEITKKYIQSFIKDMEALKVKSPTYEPKATDHIAQIIHLIKILLEKGYAYEINGDVYFSVKKFPDYGKLSGRNLEEMKAGVRISPSDKKKNPLDFALWKAYKPGEPFWESPWGPGRPGWHIECSAMALHYLGETIDIHGGGLDLIFPHHENEIAQSEAATGKPFVRYWIHNGLVTVGREKMAKSLGNFVTIKQMLSSHHPEALRLFLLSKHYRSPLDYTEEAVAEYEKALEGFYETLYMFKNLKPTSSNLSSKQERKLLSIEKEIDNFEKEFLKALTEDLNTAKAIGEIFSFEKVLQKLLKMCSFSITERHLSVAKKAQEKIKLLAGEILGILEEEPQEFIEKARKKALKALHIKREEIEALILQREEARKKKDFSQADEIRAFLSEKGIILRDTPWGTFWKVKNL